MTYGVGVSTKQCPVTVSCRAYVCKLRPTGSKEGVRKLGKRGQNVIIITTIGDVQ